MTEVALSIIRTWADARADRIECVTLREGSRDTLYVVPKAGRYDLPLGAAMTDLEITLVGTLETLQVPMYWAVGHRMRHVWPWRMNRPVITEAMAACMPSPFGDAHGRP